MIVMVATDIMVGMVAIVMIIKEVMVVMIVIVIMVIMVFYIYLCWAAFVILVMYPTLLVAHVSDKVWSLVTDILSPDHGRQETIIQFQTSPYF